MKLVSNDVLKITMPCNFCILTTIWTKYNPCVVFRQSQMDIIVTKYLASSNYSKRNTETIQFRTYTKIFSHNNTSILLNILYICYAFHLPVK